MTVGQEAQENSTPFRAPVSPKVARQILLALVVPTMLMPFVNSMMRVALPVIRDHFGIRPDMTAWVVTAFSLPFVILSTVYGRLSDGLGQRRLILIGSAIFCMGTAVTLWAPGLGWLMAGRAIQGLGTGGMFPMAMALISLVYDPRQRGKVLGTWSTTGPATGFVAPVLTGLVIERWGWRAAMVPALVLGALAFVVVYRWIPKGLRAYSAVDHDTESGSDPQDFLRTFDWVGVGLLAAWITVFLFFLSSRPITGVPPLQDWRLLGLAVVLGALFVWWESRRSEPFVDFCLFRYRGFRLGSLCASLRLFTLNGISFLIPLYLADVRGLRPATLGALVTISPGAMIVMVFLGGRLSDRWGSRWPAVVGLSMQGLTALSFFVLPETAPIWSVVAILVFYGLGNGFALAALHHAALLGIPEAQIGQASGLYSTLRFFGSVVGSALAGVILAFLMDQPLPLLSAYQYGFLVFAGSALAGALVGSQLRERESGLLLRPAKERG